MSKSEAPRRAGLPEEYTALRTEMTHLHLSVRTLWGGLFAVFVAGAAGLVALLGTLSRVRADVNRFMVFGGLCWASTILLATLIACMRLGYLWLRQAYYIGSYIVVVHEKDNCNLQWLTRNRSVSPTSNLRTHGLNISTGFAFLSRILLWLAIVPSAINLIWVVYERLDITWFLGMSVPVLAVIIYYANREYRVLKGGADERKEIELAWVQELQAVSEKQMNSLTFRSTQTRGQSRAPVSAPFGHLALFRHTIGHFKLSPLH